MPVFSVAALLLLASSPQVENAACGGSVAEQDVQYRADDGVQLAAAMIRPAKASQAVAGMVLIQGSGTSDRNNGWARAFAEELAGCGIAVLLTDKRGSGKSEGSWRTAPFERLALDAVAGLDALENQAGIDRSNTGFLGLSQGGMIAPLAAQLTDKAEVLVNVSGGVVPLKDSLQYELTQTYAQRGIPPEIAGRLGEMARASFDYLRNPQEWSKYLEIRNSFLDGKYAAAVESWPDSKEDDYWAFWKNNFLYDPAPHWQAAAARMKIPSLVIYGEEDSQDNVDVKTSINRFVGATSEALLAITAVYSDTGHLLVEKGQGRLKSRVITQIVDFIEHAKDVGQLASKAPNRASAD